MTNLIILDYQSRIPIYQQIVKQYERYIALKILNPKDQIPSIRELAQNLGINPNTVKKAYDNLEDLNLIETISTKGTFVKDSSNIAINNKINNSLDTIRGIIKELELLGLSKKEIFTKVK